MSCIRSASALAAFCVLLLSAAVSGQQQLTALACEGGELPLACPPNAYLSVTSALFGRADNNVTCPHSATTPMNTTCSAVTALVAVQALCNGRTNCELLASTSYFGDPCPGTYKYLRLQYSCMPCVNTWGDDAECAAWALDGDCTNNKAWMSNNCAMACFKCNTFTVAAATNLAGDAPCAQASSAGNCSNTLSAAWTNTYCAAACGNGELSTACVNKGASDAQCNTWLAAAQCINNTSWMLANCTASCFQCSGTVRCQDQNPNCAQWAEEGYCPTNPGYMIPICTQSCLGCTQDPVCVDQDPADCPGWVARGQCATNPVWMYNNCWKSCTGCTAAPLCQNAINDALCEVYAANGACSYNPGYMYSNCRLACTRCKPLPYGIPNCVNAQLNDTSCEIWAGQNFCVTNPSFMLTYCYKACTGCYSPSRIGASAVPGLTEVDTAAKAIILPYKFSNFSIITQFSGFFTTTSPIHLQLWRPNSTVANTFTLIYDQLLQPTAANQTQTVLLQWCVVAQANDQIGFSSLAGPASLGYVQDNTQTFYETYVKVVTSPGPFTPSFLPYYFSLSAQFVYGTSCNSV